MYPKVRLTRARAQIFSFGSIFRPLFPPPRILHMTTQCLESFKATANNDRLMLWDEILFSQMKHAGMPDVAFLETRVVHQTSVRLFYRHSKHCNWFTRWLCLETDRTTDWTSLLADLKSRPSSLKCGFVSFLPSLRKPHNCVTGHVTAYIIS